jgi:transposase
MEEISFPIQRIQTARGLEFFAIKFQENVKEYAFKFRPCKPCSPHLNDKVKRSLRLDLEKFYEPLICKIRIFFGN